MDKIRAIIIGATGMVGQGVLRECLQHPAVEAVLIISRKTLSLTHSKLSQAIIPDFSNLDSLDNVMKDYNTCFYCLGVTSVGKTEAEYRKDTLDLTVTFGKKMSTFNPNCYICFVSGLGTDSTGSGPVMWARIKGQAENALLKMPFKKVYLFRPGYIQPMDGIRSKTGWYNVFYPVFRPIYSLLQVCLPAYVTSTRRLGRAMITVVLTGESKTYITSRDINNLGIYSHSAA